MKQHCYKLSLLLFIVFFIFSTLLLCISSSNAKDDATLDQSFVDPPSVPYSQRRQRQLGQNFKSIDDYTTTTTTTSMGQIAKNQLESSFIEQLKQNNNDEKHKQMNKKILIHEGRMNVHIEASQLLSFKEYIVTLLSENDNDDNNNNNDDKKKKKNNNNDNNKKKNNKNNNSSKNTNNYYYNGYIETQEFYYDNEGLIMNIRISSETFFQFMKTIETYITNNKLGNIGNQYTKTKDVTNEYIDTSVRYDVLNDSIQSIQTLLNKADNTIQDILIIQKELNSLQQEYESMKQRTLSLQNQSKMSTLKLSIDSYDLRRNKKRSIFRAWPLRTVIEAVEDMYDIFESIIEIIIYAITWIIIIIIIGFLLKFIYKFIIPSLWKHRCYLLILELLYKMKPTTKTKPTTTTKTTTTMSNTTADKAMMP